MIVAAHQPSYLPWLGYLAKMAAADVFVVMDDLQYEAQNFQNRNRIKLARGTGWLTVPVERGSQEDRILDKRIAHEANPRQHWQHRTWATLETHYRRAPMWNVYAPALREIYTRPWTSLVDLDLAMLELARAWFRITTPVVRASTLGLTGAKTERILALVRAVGATTYLSGRGGSTTYLDVELLEGSGVKVAWHAFAHPVYAQRYPEVGFVPNLAFVDILFNRGPEGALA